MSQDLIIKRELLKLRNQRLNESNTYGFPEGSVDSGKVVTGGDNGNWGGSMDRALQIASYAKSCTGKSNVISSQKRSRVKTASGNMSDHYKGNSGAYAVDLPTKGKAGDELLACIMKKFDNGSHSDYKGGKWLNVKKDGYRYQFGWRVKDHYDHIHVGVKKIGSSSTQDEKPEDEKPEDETTQDKPTVKVKQTPTGLGQLAAFANFLKGIKDDEPEDNQTTSDETSDEVDSTDQPKVDIKNYKITEPSSEDKDFYSKVLKKIGAPMSPQNLLFFYAWRQAEGAKSTFNPFNTTHKKEGSTFWNCLKKSQGKCVGGVRNYKSKEDGIDATASTITNGNYGCIVNGLKSDKGADQIAKCSDLKKWGTGGGITRVLNTKKINPPEISKTKVKSVNESLEYEKQRIEEIFRKFM